MIPVKLSKEKIDNENKKKNDVIKKGYIFNSFIIIFFILIILFLVIIKVFIPKNTKYNMNAINNLNNKDSLNKIKKKTSQIINEKCYSSPIPNSNNKILHLIITRFLIENYSQNNFLKKIYKKEYILNGIRVMKKYLFPSLENQICKNFTWILMLGDKANITFINSFLKFENTFDKKIIYQKDIKNYIRNITKDIDVLITTRIDYDDRIYYDSVNDVRKAVNINKPMIVYGYNRGMYYYEVDDKYYEFSHTFNNQGVMSIFISLIAVLKKVKDTYTIYDLGDHMIIKKNILERYKSFGIKELNYEPTIFDSGEVKFVWVRQNYSGCYNWTRRYQKGLKEKNFSLIKFYGKDIY